MGDLIVIEEWLERKNYGYSAYLAEASDYIEEYPSTDEDCHGYSEVV